MTFDFENTLSTNQRGRWCLHGEELTSGACFEVYIDGHWIRVTLEHDGTHYIAIPFCIRLHHGLIARFLGEYTD